MPQLTTILIVDDNPANLAVLFDMLNHTDYRVLLAPNGHQAIEQAHQSQPDLLLLDINMPNMDGFETCRRLKANPDTADIPIIFLTSLTEAEDKVRGFDVGGVDYITKPFYPTEILARLNTHLTLRNLRRQLAEKNQLLTVQVHEYAADLRSETEKRRLYQRERQGLMENMQQQSEAVQELATQIKADYQRQNQQLARDLRQEVAQRLNTLQTMLTEAAPNLPEQVLKTLTDAWQQLELVIGQMAPDKASISNEWQNPILDLSKREREVFKLTVQGKTSQETGNLLNISDKTVRVYRSRLMRKLEVDTLPALIKLAVKYNLPL